MEEGAQIALYDPKVEPDQILHDLTHPAYTDFTPERGRVAGLALDTVLCSPFWRLCDDFKSPRIKSISQM